jgi:ABC-type transport system substrate-binding protein
MKWFYIVSLVVAGLLAAAPFWLPLGRPSPQDPSEVVLYDTYGAKVKSIDPATASDNISNAIQGHFYEPPYAYHFLKRPMELIGRLAQDMPQVSEDQLVYTIRLKDGVKYRRNPCFGIGADGQPLTRTVRAEDFVLAMKRIADFHVESTLAMPLVLERIEGMKQYREMTQTFDRGDFSRYDRPLSGVQAPDDRTLRIRLVEPFPQLVYVLAMTNFAPVPREAIDYYLASQDDGRGGREPIPLPKRDPQIRQKEAAVGTGPYYLAKFESGGEIELRYNEDFREDFYPSEGADDDRAAGLLDDAGRRVPFVKVRKYVYSQEDYPSWMLFLTGQTDISGIPRDVFAQVIQPGVKLNDELRRRGIRLLTFTNPSVYWLAFNLEDPVVGKSKSLRQALQLSFDVEQYIETLYNGRGIRTLTYIPSELEGYDQAHSPYARFDVAAAQEKLAQARSELAAAGVIEPGHPIPSLTLDTWDRDDQTRRMSEYCMQQFARIGLKLKIKLNDWPTLLQKVDKKQCQIYTIGWGADYPDPENFLQLYYSPNIPRGTNQTNYVNPEFDRLYERARVMPLSPARTELYVRMLKMLNEDCPNLLLTQPVYYVLVQPWVHNNKPHPYGSGNGRYIRIDAPLRRAMGGR